VKAQMLVGAVVGAVFGLAACTASYQQRETGGIEASSIRLDPGKSVFVAVPVDGQYGSRVYAGTGRTVAQKTAAAFSRYSPRVEVSSSTTTNRDELLAAARRAGAGYLVIPGILHWEQRATEWSGIPSRVSISMTVVDVGTRADLRAGLLESRSAVMTFVRPNPDVLAQNLIDENVALLYGVKVPSQQ
jgi:hypothetical protein